jgi:glycosyltransferase involved in cell wall biosynthesis
MKRALFVSTPYVGFLGNGAGVLKHIKQFEKALTEKNIKVGYWSPWEQPNWDSYDLCHLFVSNGDTYNLFQRIKKQLPVVITPIFDRLPKKASMKLNLTLEKLLPTYYSHLGRCLSMIAKCDGLALSSSYEREILNKLVNIQAPQKICYIPLDISVKKVQPPSSGTNMPDMYVFFVGDLGNPRKNVIRLIESAEKGNFKLVMAGDLKKGSLFKSVSNAINSSKNVTYIGVVSESEKNWHYQNSDSVILPSIFEGIGLSSVEAGLMGASVIVTENGGPRDYFADKAFYVNPYSVNSIIRSVKTSLSAPIKCEERLKEICNYSKCGDSLLSLYQRVLG